MTDQPQPLNTRTIWVDPKTLDTLSRERNARFMKAHQFKQLVANIKRDGCLTQLPLVHKGVVLSGNHRVKASIEAGLESIEIQELLGDYTEDRLLAIQLSHNAISGEDDPNTLKDLYEELPYIEKLYSGITDDMFEAEPLDLSSLGAGATQYQEIVLTFLPEDADKIAAFVKRIEKDNRRWHFVADLTMFDDLFDTIIAVKRKQNVYNTALALRAMMELALDRLLQLDEQDTDADETEDQAD